MASAMDADGWASTYESLSAFDETNLVYGKRPDYVRPIITNLGSVFNSNWVSSAGVPQHISYEVGLPFALVPMTSGDREYGNGNPTIFGGNDIANATRYSTDACDASVGFNCPVVNGNETLNGLGVFTFPYLQFAGGFYHARIVLRGMWLPSISELRSFSVFGFGLQYSFGHFFQYMLPRAAQPLDVSLMFGYTTSGIGYQPEDYTGQLDLDISAFTINMVVGYKPLPFVEAMISLGYQYANMNSSGHLVNTKNPLEQINPTLSVKGENGFRFGLEVAFSLGSFNPVVGYDYVGKSAFTTNLIYFKQTLGKDKTPSEIAQEKGVSSASEKADSAPAAESANDSSEETSDESNADEDSHDSYGSYDSDNSGSEDSSDADSSESSQDDSDI